MVYRKKFLLKTDIQNTWCYSNLAEITDSFPQTYLIQFAYGDKTIPWKYFIVGTYFYQFLFVTPYTLAKQITYISQERWFSIGTVFKVKSEICHVSLDYYLYVTSCYIFRSSFQRNSWSIMSLDSLVKLNFLLHYQIN